ncbi:hypothetical protein EV356DRAFT_188118 [Viridothelium virens]|uniref:Extracellular membrane protein CFEM domain-containing protein n=1 Tax=Viridothelium virens TaxID=1048519 RepID=A0A6A6H7M4_VIRVR|nr:hypothetical protein EV356DRAFT_188118 [Viridothelium virens]
MFAKASLVFALFAASAQVAFAVPPSCLLDAINTQPNSADLKSICGKNAGAVKSAITSGCGSNIDDAMSAFKKVCSGVDPTDGGNSTSTTSSLGASGTGSSGGTSTVPIAPAQPSAPNASSGGRSGSASATSSGGVASSTGAASSLEISSFAGVAVAALGFALAL